MNKPDDETLARLRVRIAELCGWTRTYYLTAKSDTWVAPGARPEFPTGKLLGVWPSKRDDEDKDPFDRMGIPDYTASLDAMHEAVAKSPLKPAEGISYANHVRALVAKLYGCSPYQVSYIQFLEAPAFIRAIALDRTLSKEPIV